MYRMQARLVAIILGWCACTIAGSAAAGFSPFGSWAPTPNGTVYAMAEQDFAGERYLLVGGAFTTIGGANQSGIARLRADGTSAGLVYEMDDGAVHAIAVYPNGAFLAGGSFTSISGAPRSRIARFDAVGNPDFGFAASIDNGMVLAMALQDNGRILIGGTFTSVNGQPRQHLARLMPDGSLDSAFNPGANGAVHALVVQDDDKILVGGAYQQIAGVERTGIARLHSDGRIDSIFHEWGSQTNGPVYAIAVQADDKIVIGGDFSLIAGSAYNLARLRPNGNRELVYQPFTNGPVRALAVQADGRILVGGEFSEICNVPRNGLARLGFDLFQPVEPDFNPNVHGGAGVVHAVLEQDDRKAVFGGAFALVGNHLQFNLGRVYPDGELDLSLLDASIDLAPSGNIRATAMLRSGKILIGGNFGTVSGETYRNLARLLSNGKLDTSFSNPQINAQVMAIGVQPDGKIVVGGTFTSVAGQSRAGLARLEADGTLDTGFANADINGHVSCVLVLKNGKVIIGGLFNEVGGHIKHNLARILPNGLLDQTFGGGTNGTVHDLSLDSLDRLVVAGDFSEASNGIGSVSRANLARFHLDGSIDDLFDIEVVNSSQSRVRAVSFSLFDRNWIGGTFDQVDGTAHANLATLDAILGVEDLDLDANGSVDSLARHVNGSVVATGTFSEIASGPYQRVARLEVTESGIEHDFRLLGLHPDSFVETSLVLADGKTLLGGSFTEMTGIGTPRVARLNASGFAREVLEVEPGGGSFAFWRRAGFGPQVDVAYLRISLTGAANSFSTVGQMQPFFPGGGWYIDRQVPWPVNQTFWLRARGFIYGNGNTSIIEYTRQFHLRDEIYAQGFECTFPLPC